MSLFSRIIGGVVWFYSQQRQGHLRPKLSWLCHFESPQGLGETQLTDRRVSGRWVECDGNASRRGNWSGQARSGPLDSRTLRFRDKSTRVAVVEQCVGTPTGAGKAIFSRQAGWKRPPQHKCKLLWGTRSYLMYRRPLASYAMHLPRLLKTFALSTLS